MPGHTLVNKWLGMRRGQLFESTEIQLSTDNKVGILYTEVVRADYGPQSSYVPPLHRILSKVDVFFRALRTVEGWSITSYRLLDEHLFVTLRREEGVDDISTLLYRAANELKTQMEVFLRETFASDANVVDIRFGTSLLRPTGKSDVQSLFLRGALSAMNQARTIEDATSMAQRAEFMDILQHRRVQSYFQPIVSLWTADTFGYEALSRGPAGSTFFSPLKLFDYADRHGHLNNLEDVTLTHAIESYKSDGPTPRKLFLNINASTLLETEFVVQNLMVALDRFGLTPHDIVLEVTERRAIDDFVKFHRTLQRYRHHGFLLAIDDVGSGYSSLQTIVELKPDFIKIDRSLIRGIQDDYVKEAVVQGLCQTALTFDCATIAEGIETVEELTRVAQIGVTYGQGFFLGRPSERVKAISDKTAWYIKQSMSTQRGMVGARNIGQITQPVHTFPPHAEAREVVQFFNRHENVAGVVIVDDDKPIGLVMREKIFRKLATKYGVSLFWNRSIQEIMERNPLVLDENVSVENSSILSMGRHTEQLYDLIVVTRNGKLFGSVTIQMVLNTITNAQLELARDANPLTGLPGNAQIEREIPKRIAAGQSFSLIYLDLDNFKGFNDTFGFRLGDQAIQALAECIVNASKAFPDSNVFVGHIGGDDFILLTESQSDMELASSIQSAFASVTRERFPQLHEQPTSMRDRSGRVIESEALTLSISILTCEAPFYQLTQEDLSLLAGRLKQRAKEQGGNQIITERYQRPLEFHELTLSENELIRHNIEF